jgi:hypothetical protein
MAVAWALTMPPPSERVGRPPLLQDPKKRRSGSWRRFQEIPAICSTDCSACISDTGTTYSRPTDVKEASDGNFEGRLTACHLDFRA